MSESEFLSGEIANKHLQNAAPTIIETAGEKKGLPDLPCDTYFTASCGLTEVPGPCDFTWVKQNPAPKDFVKKYGPAPWKTPPEKKKPVKKK